MAPSSRVLGGSVLSPSSSRKLEPPNPLTWNQPPLHDPAELSSFKDISRVPQSILFLPPTLMYHVNLGKSLSLGASGSPAIWV